MSPSDRAAATTPERRSDSGPVPGDVVISIGTSGTVFAVADQQSADASGAVAGFADASGRFLPLIATLNAARVLVSAAKLLGVELDALAELALQGAARLRRCGAGPLLRG